MSEIEEAITRVIAGPEKKSRVVSEKDRRCTALHEVGHAILAHKLENCDPVHEISIIQRGMAAGYTMTLPEDDRQHVFRSKLLDDIAMMLGGRVAEALTLDDISTGAVNDLQRATATAREMVTKYGMSAEVGPVFLSDNHEVFLGREFGQQSAYSEITAAKVDAEVKKILETAYTRAKEILESDIEKLTGIAEVLIAREKLTGEEFASLYENGSIEDNEAEEENVNTVIEDAADEEVKEEAETTSDQNEDEGSFNSMYDPEGDNKQ